MDESTTAILVAGGIVVSGIIIFRDDIRDLFKPENEHDKNVDSVIAVISGNADELTEEELEIVIEGTKDDLQSKLDAGILTEEEYNEIIASIDEKGLADCDEIVELTDDVEITVDELFASGDLTQEGYDILQPKAHEVFIRGHALDSTINLGREENKDSNDPVPFAEFLDSFSNTLEGHRTLAAASCATVAALILWIKRGRPGAKWLIEKIRALTNPDEPLDPNEWDTRSIPTFSYTYSHPDTDVDFNPEPIIGGVSINPEITVKTYPDPIAYEVNIPESTPPLTDEQHARWLRFKELFETVFEPGETTQTVYPLIEPYLPDIYQNLIDPNNPPDAITFIQNFIPDDIVYNYDENNQIKWFVNNGMWWMVDRFMIAVIGILAGIIVIAAVTAPEVAAAVAAFSAAISPFAAFAA